MLPSGRSAALALAALLVPAGGTALASELLVMPYSCIVAGGRPVLAPGPEQGHQIIGRRDQRTFTACSPANPRLCRTWTVYRFDVDCDGTPVPWTSVVAAAAAGERSQTAWIDGGRLVVRVPRAWSFDEDDPCARRSKFSDGFGFGRMRRHCDERSAAMPPFVAMPEGFAPMLGIDAVFVKSALPPAVGEVQTPPGPAALPAPPPPAAAAPAPPPKVARAETPPPPRPEPPAAPVQEHKAAPPPPPPAPAAKAAPPQPPKAAPPPPQSGGPVVPKIINRPDAGDADKAAQAEPRAPAPAPAPAAASPPPRDKAANATAPEPQPGPDDTPATVGLLSIAGSPAAGAFAAFLVLTSALLAAFLIVRRREQLQANARPRDVAGAQLYRPRPGRRAAARAVALRPPAAPPPPPPQPHAAPPALGANMPRTRSEAIHVLGMGVTANASEAAIKKVVDGLRQSWHPDLAQDEDDRRMRELRLKQINAAWDILQGRRGEV